MALKDKMQGPERRHLPLTIECRETQKEDGTTVRTVAGYAVRYESESVPMRDWVGDEFVEVIAKGAFDDSLKRGTVIKALWSHDTAQVLGSTRNGTLRLRSDDEGIYFELDLPNTTIGNDAWESIRRGDVDGMSFGFWVLKEKWSREKRDGKTIYKRTILEGELVEVSPVAFPAYPATSVHVRSLDEYRESLRREMTRRKLLLEVETMG